MLWSTVQQPHRLTPSGQVAIPSFGRSGYSADEQTRVRWRD